MEQSFADLLSDAFSETSVPSFPDGDLDFENLNFDAKFEENKTDISHKSLSTKEEEALHQEATAQTAVSSSMQTKDAYTAENADTEQPDEMNFQGAGIMSMEETLEDDYTSSDDDYEQEGSVSGDDEEDEDENIGTGEKPGDLLMSVGCRDEYSNGSKEDKIFAEGQPLAQEGADNPQVRNEEQGDSESDEEVSYFKRVPERGSEMTIKGDGIDGDEQETEEDKQEDSSDSESEGMKVEQGENVLAQRFEEEFENPCRDDLAKASLDFPEISMSNLQDLIAEVESEEYVEKMKDFSEEEHQGPGESFADYPSDFSSCEYEEDGGKNKEGNHQSMAKQDTCLEGAGTDMGLIGKAQNAAEVGDEYLYSIDLEVDADKFRSLDVATGGITEIVEQMLCYANVTGSDDGGEAGESDSCSSSDDEVQEKRRIEELFENMRPQDVRNHKQWEELHDDARWSISDDYNRADQANFNISWNLDASTPDSFLSEDLLTTENTDEAETLFSDMTQRPAEDVNSYSAVQRQDTKTTSPSNLGSLDDSFFFETELEASGISELGQLGDDEYEEERNWEQEQERIKAFYEFYDDSDAENGREERKIKVQFCSDPLSQVIHYETDSSEQDSLSSSTDGEEDQSSAEQTPEELREPDDTTQMKLDCDPPNTQLPENVPALCNTQNCTQKHKYLNALKVTLRMVVVIVMGLLMFWLATDEAGWLG